jgi:hypothetical protein
LNISDEKLTEVNDEIEVLLNNYQDEPVSVLMNRFDIFDGAKNSFSALTKRLIAYTNLINISQLNDDNNLVIKTIRLDKYGRLKESMSFPAFKYEELYKENWEDSDLRNLFLRRTFAFVVYQGKDRDSFLKKIVLWRMPDEVLENGVRPVWEKTKRCISEGSIVKYVDQNGRYFTFFPSSTENPYVHVRPHAQNRNDTYDLPVADKLTGLVKYPKHCFWLNRAYILKIISREGL